MHHRWLASPFRDPQSANQMPGLYSPSSMNSLVERLPSSLASMNPKILRHSSNFAGCTSASPLAPSMARISSGVFPPSLASAVPVNSRNTSANSLSWVIFLLSLSAQKNVELPLLLTRLSRAERKKRAAIALDIVGLSHRARHYPRQLSGGEQQRVGIARAIVAHPKVVVADEPTGDLDHKTGGEIIQLMRDLAKNQNRAVIAATHDPETARMADRILLLRDGVLVDEMVGEFFRASKVDVSTKKTSKVVDEETST